MTSIVNTNKQLRIYGSHAEYTRVSVDEAISRGLNAWRGWECSAGVRGLYIDYDSNLWRCNAASAKLDRFNKAEWKAVEFLRAQGDTKPDTSKVFQKVLSREEGSRYWGFLGNVEDSYDLPADWATCPYDSCGCGADVVLSKAQVGNRDKLLVTAEGYAGQTRSMHAYTESDVSPTAVELNYPSPYQVLWDIGRFCNYDCSYCWSSIHNRTSPHKDYEMLKRVSYDLIDRWAKGQQIRWNFGGGEPTLHPHFSDWMLELKSRGQWTLVTTNGSRDHKYWKDLIPFVNSVNLSAHFSSIDEDRFVRNIEVICDYFDNHSGDHWLEVKLMATPEYFDRALSLRDKIRSLNRISRIGANGRINGALSMVPIRSLGDSGKVVEYTSEQLSVLSHQ